MSDNDKELKESRDWLEGWWACRGGGTCSASGCAALGLARLPRAGKEWVAPLLLQYRYCSPGVFGIPRPLLFVGKIKLAPFAGTPPSAGPWNRFCFGAFQPALDQGGDGRAGVQ